MNMEKCTVKAFLEIFTDAILRIALKKSSSKWAFFHEILLGIPLELLLEIVLEYQLGLPRNFLLRIFQGFLLKKKSDVLFGEHPESPHENPSGTPYENTE